MIQYVNAEFLLSNDVNTLERNIAHILLMREERENLAKKINYMHFQPIYGFGHLLYSRKMNIKGPFAIIENISLKDLVKKSMKLKASLIIIKG